MSLIAASLTRHFGVGLTSAAIALALIRLQAVDPSHDAGQLSRPQTPVIQEFKNATGYPRGRHGFVVDHKIPLCAGGPDAIDNLQWQELRKSYQKDAFERQLCAEMKRQGYRLVKVEQQ